VVWEVWAEWAQFVSLNLFVFDNISLSIEKNNETRCRRGQHSAPLFVSIHQGDAMHDIAPIKTPNDDQLDALCGQLREWSGRWSTVAQWPAESLQLCGKMGVFRWFLPKAQGGYEWSSDDQTRGYLRLAGADLTTTFVITQYIGAMRRIAGSGNDVMIERWLNPLAAGQQFGTVGISHLTTSRRHLDRPVLLASEVADGFLLQGMSPWVTGAPHAEVYVIGATLEDGREILAAVPRDLPGVQPGGGAELVGLSASCTDRVGFESVFVPRECVLAGPVEEVMKTGSGAGPGGLQTSTLAIGLARAAANYLLSEASRREDLNAAALELAREVGDLEQELIDGSSGQSGCNPAEIRGRSNRMVLRATQAAMTAAKGAGYVEGHPVGRWCREALFFLVWSCPAPIAQAHLCEFAFGPEH
jgi:alkylation response protein AidB-like acyl-CoA dehydrogenase